MKMQDPCGKINNTFKMVTAMFWSQHRALLSRGLVWLPGFAPRKPALPKGKRNGRWGGLPWICCLLSSLASLGRIYSSPMACVTFSFIETNAQGNSMTRLRSWVERARTKSQVSWRPHQQSLPNILLLVSSYYFSRITTTKAGREGHYLIRTSFSTLRCKE